MKINIRVYPYIGAKIISHNFGSCQVLPYWVVGLLHRVGGCGTLRECAGMGEIPALSGFISESYRMSNRQYFAILDTETTVEDTVCDIGIAIVDRNGKIYKQMAVLVSGHYGNYELFHDKHANDIWGYAGLNRRKQNYVDMLANGSRIMASVNAVNVWIQKAIAVYNPTLTAYNLAFDVSKCQNTGIDLNGFENRFCLWQAAVGNICNTRQYKEFVLDHHLFNKPTDKGNMTFKTNAEVVCGFITGTLIDEPHTAIEDAINFELPILTHILKKRNWRDNVTPYDWNKFQVRNHFKV